MLSELQQFHIKNDYYFKIQQLDKYSCKAVYPKKDNLPKHERTYKYENGYIIVTDSYLEKSESVDVPIYVFRSAVLLDILLKTQAYNISHSLIILFNNKDKPLQSQDIFTVLPIKLNNEEAKIEKELIGELVYILNEEFKDTSIEGYDFLQQCTINGGLIL